MEKEFVTTEIAFKLRELGFDEPCMGYRTEYGSFSMKMKVTNSKLDKQRKRYSSIYKGRLPDMAAAPLWQQAFEYCLSIKSGEGYLYIIKDIDGLTLNILNNGVTRTLIDEASNKSLLEKLIEYVKS